MKLIRFLLRAARVMALLLIFFSLNTVLFAQSPIPETFNDGDDSGWLVIPGAGSNANDASGASGFAVWDIGGGDYRYKGWITPLVSSSPGLKASVRVSGTDIEITDRLLRVNIRKTESDVTFGIAYLMARVNLGTGEFYAAGVNGAGDVFIQKFFSGGSNVGLGTAAGVVSTAAQ